MHVMRYAEKRKFDGFALPGELGDMLGVSNTVVLQWAKAKKIPSVKLPSGRYIFDPDAVIAALKSNGRQQTILTGRL